MLAGTETVEAPIADQVPAEPQTEVEAPELELDAAAEAPEAAAPEEKPLTRAEVEQMLREREDSVRRQTAADLQRQRQRENARIANEQKLNDENRKEMADLTAVELYRLGATEVQPDQLMPVLDRYAQRQSSQVRQRTVTELADVYSVATARALGLDSDIDLSPNGEQWLGNVEGFVKAAFDKRDELMTKNGDYIHKSELPKLIAAGVKAELAKSRNGREPLKTVEGTASAADQSDDARLYRINSQQATDDDRRWWTERYGHIR